MENRKPRSNPSPSTLSVTTDGVGQIKVEGQSLPWMPPRGLVEVCDDGRRRVINPDGTPGRYLA